MKPQIRSLLAAAIVVAFPLAISAQSSGSGSSGAAGNRSSTGSSTSSSNTTRSTNSPSSTSGSMSGTSSGSMSGQSGVSSFQRVSKDSIEGQLTAKALIGKNVYDNQGERLGEVQDVVLDSAAAPQLASAISTRSEHGSSRSAAGTMTSSASSNEPRSAMSGAGSTGTSANRNTSATGSTDRSHQMTNAATSAWDSAKTMAGMTGGAAAIVSTGGMFSRNDLVRVPLSQLNYDSSNDRLTINATKSQFSSLTESDETSRNAAE